MLNDPSSHIAEDDDGWSHLVDIRIAPHRHLSADQAEVVKAELFGGAEKWVVQARNCLAMYVIQELRAATDPDAQKPPDYQIEVANAADLKSIMFSKA